jgi:hypothetical protein
MNTSYGNEPHNEAKLAAEGITLHPEDAAARGLVEGAMARLTNDAGELLMPVHVDAKAPPGIALAVKGAWPKRQGDHRFNALHAARRISGESTAVRRRGDGDGGGVRAALRFASASLALHRHGRRRPTMTGGEQGAGSGWIPTVRARRNVGGIAMLHNAWTM